MIHRDKLVTSYISDKIIIVFFLYKVSRCFYRSVWTDDKKTQCKGRYITLNSSVILREIEILHANLSRNWNQYLTVVLTGALRKRKQQMFARTNNARLVGAWCECDRARSSATMIFASEDIKYLSHGKVAFMGKPKEGTRPHFIRAFAFLLTQTNCLSRDILALLSLFILITREETRIFASLSLSFLLSLSLFLSLPRTSPPAGKTADFTSVRLSEHGRPRPS